MSESKTIKVSPDFILGKKSSSKRPIIIPSKVHENLNQLKKKLLDKLQGTRTRENNINIGVQPEDIKDKTTTSSIQEKKSTSEIFQEDMHSLETMKNNYENKQ